MPKPARPDLYSSIGDAASLATDYVSRGGSAAFSQAEIASSSFARGLSDVGVAGKAQSPKTGGRPRCRVRGRLL